MKSLFRIFLLGSRLVVASLLGLCLQITLVVKSPERLLTVQEEVKRQAVSFFGIVEVNPQYQVAYNLIGGDNIIVHTLFVLVAYVAILIVLLPFRPRRRAPIRHG